MRTRSILFLVSLGIVSVFSQVQEIDQTDKINALKRELEESRKLRDLVLTKRWEDKRKYTDSREEFNEMFLELKSGLEMKNLEREKLLDQISILTKNLEEQKAELETEKSQFLGLSYIQKTHVRDWVDKLYSDFPYDVANRQEYFNRLLKMAEENKDSPESILREIVKAYSKEITTSREITLSEKPLVLADFETGEGMYLRIGTYGAAYQDKNTGRVGILLKTGSSGPSRFEWHEGLVDQAENALSEFFKQAVSVQKGQQNWQDKIIPLDILQSSMVMAGYTQEKQTFIQKFVSTVKSGGVWMIPLFIVAIFALLIAIERYFVWFSKSRVSPKQLDVLVEKIKMGQISEAKKIAEANAKNPTSKCILSLLNSSEKNRPNAEKDFQETVLQEIPKLEKRLTTLSVLGATAPLLGLLGTIVGMIQLFETITVYGSNDPKLMASGISVALVTTEAGLIIAIPVMLMHNYLSNCMDQLIQQIEDYGLRVTNLIWPKG